MFFILSYDNQDMATIIYQFASVADHKVLKTFCQFYQQRYQLENVMINCA